MSSADETKVAHRRLAASSQELNGEMKIVLSPGEQKICDLLDVVSKQLEKEKGLKVELRIAGGWVRDKLLGLDCHDLDIAIDTMMGFEFATYVNEYLVQNRGHKSHSIAKIATNPAKSKHLETATMVVYGAPLDFVNLRSEIYDDTSRIPTEITFGTPSEDAYRRDTTINALFYNIHTRSVEDFTGRGLLDLKEGLIRTPLTSFATFEQDPLRVMRCIRFAARFHFRISDDAKLAILDPRIKEALKTKISKERIGAELDKMIDDGAGRSTAIGLLQELDLYDVVFAAPTISPPGTAKSAMTTAVEGEVGDAQVAFKLVWILEWLLKMNVAPGLMDTSAKSLSSLPKTTLEHQDAGQVLLLQQTASQPEKTSFLRPLISTPVSAVVAQTAQQPVEDPLESVRIGTRNLILSGMLYPYKDMKAIVNKKSTSAIAWIFRYGLKGRNHDIDMVVRLMEFLPTVKEVVHRHWNEVKEGDETKMEHHKPQAGMLIRDIGFLAIIGQRWPCAFLLSLAVDLVPKFEQLHAGVLDTETTTTLEMYNHFLAEARRLKIEDTYGWKYIVDGSQLSMLLGIKTGPKITVLLRKVMEWQVQNHPGGSRDSCVEWIRAHPELFQ